MRKYALALAAALAFADPACAENVKIRIGFPSAGSLVSGQVGMALMNTDILANNGLDAEVTPFLYGPPMQEALLAGHLDIALTSEANYVNLAAKFPCRMIATLGVAGRIALMVREDSPVKSVKDLKGKTVTTVFGTSAHYPAVQWLLKAGLTPDKDVKLVHMAAAEGRAALVKGDVDAIVMWDPFVEDFVRKKAARIVEANPSFWTTTVVSEEFAKANPEAVTRFVTALNEALLYVAGHKEAANGWLSATMGVTQELIDKGSGFNKNYAKSKKPADIDTVPGPELLKRLEGIVEFNFATGLNKTKSPAVEKTDLTFAKAAKAALKKSKFDPSKVVVKAK